jgi:hypothetical protein
MANEIKTESNTETREQLVAERRRLGRAMANELQSDFDFNALRRARDTVDAKITALDAK